MLFVFWLLHYLSHFLFFYFLLLNLFLLNFLLLNHLLFIIMNQQQTRPHRTRGPINNLLSPLPIPIALTLLLIIMLSIIILDLNFLPSLRIFQLPVDNSLMLAMFGFDVVLML